MAFWVDDFPFPKVGYVNSLEGSSSRNLWKGTIIQRKQQKTSPNKKRKGPGDEFLHTADGQKSFQIYTPEV